MTLARMTVMALLLGGCDHILDVRVQNDVLCVPALQQTFAAPSGQAAMLPIPIPGTVMKAVTLDFSKPLQQIPGEQAGLKLDVRLDEVFIRSVTTAGAPPADLSFVKRVKVAMEPSTPNPDLPSVYIGQYEKGLASAGITELKIKSQYDVNVIRYVKQEPIKLIFTATGTLPKDAFTANIEACVFVQGQGAY
jgi:hypothetical protein